MPSEFASTHAPPSSSSLSDPVLHPVLSIPTPSVGEPLDDTRGEEVMPWRASTPIKSSARLSTGIELFSSSILEIHEPEDEFIGGASAPSGIELNFEEVEGLFSEAKEAQAELEPAVVQPIEVKDPVKQQSKETLYKFRRLNCHNSPGLREDERISTSRLRSRQSGQETQAE